MPSRHGPSPVRLRTRRCAVRPAKVAALPNLRLIVSPGAGVDHITRDPAWPAHLPLVRMGEYVCLACLALLRDWRRITLAQAEGRWENIEAGRCAPEVTVGVMGLGNLGSKSASHEGAACHGAGPGHVAGECDGPC